MSKVTINRDLCEKCGTCVLSCPNTVFIQKDKKSVPDLIHEDLCVSCGHFEYYYTEMEIDNDPNVANWRLFADIIHGAAYQEQK